MGLDELRARLDRLLSGSLDRRTHSAGLHDALVELKVAAGQSRDALAAAERELATEQKHLEDARRRGPLAEQIGDAETARIAGEFAAKHSERIGLLERKVSVIRDELAYVEREYQSLAAQLHSVRQGTGPAAAATPSPDEESDRELEALRMKADRESVQHAVQQQLELLKKKLGKK